MANHKVAELLGLRNTKGDVGIEIEMEGKSRFPYEISKWWKAEEDNSLRGYSVEYVMKKPMPLDLVGDALDLLKEEIQLHGSKPVYSERAGVHVHVNVQDLTMDQVFCTAMVYYCLEKALVRYCGENREGNHFCLRVQDADYVLDVIESALIHRNLRFLDTEDIRYASLNFCSLFKYGSIEFRAMETRPDFSKIKEWASMLVAIRNYARELEDYERIPAELSGSGPTGWARQILGDELFNLINYPEFDRDVMRCMRPIQHLFHMKKAA